MILSGIKMLMLTMKLAFASYMPKADDIDLNGLEEEVTAEDMRELLSVEVDGWKNEMMSIKEHYARFGDRLPQELIDQLSALKTSQQLWTIGVGRR
jgi:GTP-dependent phosphoenolpyruvate carboxykinase